MWPLAWSLGLSSASSVTCEQVPTSTSSLWEEYTSSHIILLIEYISMHLYWYTDFWRILAKEVILYLWYKDTWICWKVFILKCLCSQVKLNFFEAKVSLWLFHFLDLKFIKIHLPGKSLLQDCMHIIPLIIQYVNIRNFLVTWCHGVKYIYMCV